MFCPKCGSRYEGNPAFCQSCGSPLPGRAPSRVGDKGSARAKKPTMAALATLSLMCLAVGYKLVSSVVYNIDEDGNFEWVKALAQFTVVIPMVLVIYAVAQLIHRIIKHTWIDFRGWWRWWREFLPS